MKPLYQRSAALALASVFTLWGAAAQANSVASSNGAALADIAIQSNWGAGYCEKNEDTHQLKCYDQSGAAFALRG